jgi:hypothetical protein
MILRKLFGMFTAILIFLGLVILSSFIIDHLGYDSSNLFIKVLTWFFSSIIAFEVYNWIVGEDEP